MSDLARRLAGLSREQRLRVEVELARERGLPEPIAVVGMGCRFPGAASPEEYWRLLADGRSAVGEVPADRWSVDALYDPEPSAPGKMSSRWGGFLDRVDTFDPEFFGIAPREAVQIDPQQRLVLETAWEALEDAAWIPEELAGTATGVFVGVMTADYAQTRLGDLSVIDAYTGPGNAYCLIANRVSYLLGLAGPSLAVDTACSSALAAVHLACQSLRSGECSTALAGGVNVMLWPGHTVYFSKAGLMAADGRCKTFDARADGIVRGEGAGVVVLERLSDALAAGRRVRALVRGTAINQDGRSNGLTAPSRQAQEAVLAAAYAQAGVDPAEVGYVEAHGTGTPLGDPIEAKALGAVLSVGRDPDRPLRVGSAKTNLGHLEAAAGVAGLIKTVLALEHRELPASLHFSEPNPAIPFDDLGLRVQARHEPWPDPERPAVAGVSSFGFGGTNVHAVLEAVPGEDAAPPADRPDRPERSAHVLVLGARDPEARRQMAGLLAERLEAADGPALADLCHGVATGRTRFEHRLAAVAGSAAEMAEALRAVAAGAPAPGVELGERARRPGGVAFLFTGQGAQRPGMGRELYRVHPRFRRSIDRATEILRPHLERPLADLLFDESGEEIHRTRSTQPALVAFEWALADLVESWGVRPDAVAGHSLGEIAAATVAGVWDLEDVLPWVAERGRLMDGLDTPGRMVSVFAPEARLAEILAADPALAAVDLAAVNGPRHLSASGPAEAIERLVERLDVEGVRHRGLDVSQAFHSALMEPILEPLERAARRLTPRSPRVPWISNLTAEAMRTAPDAAYWRRHARQPVRFADGVETLVGLGARVLVEIGPAATLLGLARRVLPDGAARLVPTLRKGHDEWTSLGRAMGSLTVAGIEVDWTAFDEPWRRRRVALPTYPFQRRRFWLEPSTAPAPVTGDSFHPLLGHRASSVGGTVTFERDLGVDSHPTLAEHRVLGRPVVPAAWFLASALAAHEKLGGAGPVSLEAVTLAEPLVLDAEAPCRVRLTWTRDDGDLRDTGSSSWRVESLDGERARLHVSGRLVPGAGPSPAAVDPPEPAEGDVEELSGDRLYADLAGRRSLELGPSFRRLDAVRRRGDEAWARLDATPAPPLAAHLSPGFLDALFHGVAALLPEEGTFVPLAIDALRFAGPLPEELAVHARITHGATGETATGEVVARDADGVAVAEVTGLQLKKARQMPGASGAEARTLALAWRPVTPDRRAAEGSWLLLGGPQLGDAGFDVAELGAALESRGARVLTATPAVGDEASVVDAWLARDAPGPRRVVDLAPAALSSPEDGDELVRRAADACWRTVALAGALSSAAGPSAHLAVVTRGAWRVSAEDPAPAVLGAVVAGFGASLALEHPELAWAAIDLANGDDGDDGDDGDELRAAALISALVGGLQGAVAVRDGGLLAPRLVDAGGGATAKPRDMARGAHLITGGLGALGLQVAAWLVERGARHLVLAGRGAPSAAARETIARLCEGGARVDVAALDVTRRGEVEELVASLAADGGLAGVYHAAGVLDDRLALGHEPEQLARVLAPKLQGAWNLRRAIAATAGTPPERWVLFSSLAALVGSPGQAGYGAANAGLAALAEGWAADGLDARVVDWGPWVGPGMAAGGDTQAWLRRGIGTLEPDDALVALGAVLAGPDSRRAVATIAPRAPRIGELPLLEELAERPGTAERDRSRTGDGDGEGDRDGGAAPGFLVERLAALPALERRPTLEAHARQTVAVLLGLPTGRVDPDQPLAEMGFDSLMAVELRNELQRATGTQLPATLAFDHPTVTAIAGLLDRELPAVGVAAAPPAPVAAPAVASRDQREAGERPARDGIAIVGLGCRFPGGASDPDSFWRLLIDGVDAVTEVPADRWDAAALYDADPDAPGKTSSRWGGFVDGVDRFDAQFFSIPPAEAAAMDPQQRLLLEVAWEALERSGQAAIARDGSLTGVFVGLTTNDYSLMQLGGGDLARVGGYYGTGTAFSAAAGRLSYALGLQGPSMAVDTACSSSLVSVHLACQSLAAGECDLALAGGANVLLSPLGHVYSSKIGVMAADGRCKSFDAAADGYVRGEGCGIVVLKRLSDAVAQGDRILAVVRGSAVNQDGRSSGLTAPNGLAQQAVVRRALAVAGVERSEIAYVEAHGSGTRLGDPIEARALGAVFGDDPERRQPVAIGSVKTNLGHLEAGAGVAGLIKLVLALDHGQLPPSLHFHQPNPEIPFDQLPIRVQAELGPWPVADGDRRLAGISSFGFSGTNAHLVVEQAPTPSPEASSRDWHLVPLSAPSLESLDRVTERLAERLADGDAPVLDLADVSHTLQTGRKALAVRRTVVARDAADAAAALAEPASGRVATREVDPEPRSIAFVLTGVGDHYAGMGRDLYRQEPVFRRTVDECAELLAPRLGLDLKTVLFPRREAEAATRPGLDLKRMLGRSSATPPDDDPLAETRIAHPAVLVVELALARLLASWGIEPRAMIGYSLGEYAVACLAGVLPWDACLTLVAERARLIQELPAGAMLAVPLGRRELASLLPEGATLSALNGPALSVVSGRPEAVSELEERCAAAGTVCRRLNASHPFHSALLAPIAGPLERLLEGVELAPPRVPYVSNVTGDWITAEQATDPAYWVRQMLEPVEFHRGLSTLLADSRRIVLEVGPGQALSSFVKQHEACSAETAAHVMATLPHAHERRDDLEHLLKTVGRLWLAGVPLPADGLHTGERRLRVALPTTPFERRRYWIDGGIDAGGPDGQVGDGAGTPVATIAGASARAGTPPIQSVADWFYLPTWRQRGGRDVSAAPLPASERDSGTWLVLAGETSLSRVLVQALEERGDRVHVVGLDEGAVEGWLDRALAAIDGRLRGVLHLWSLEPAGDGPELSFEERQARGLRGLAAVAAGARAHGPLVAGPLPVIAIVDGLCSVTGAEEMAVDRAALRGALRVMPQEHPGMVGRLLDVSEQEGAEEIVRRLLSELVADPAQPVMALRGRRWWSLDYERLDLGPELAAASPLRDGGVYLLIGGLGGVGSVVARRLAEEHGARLVLLGRTELPPRERWPELVEGEDGLGLRLRRLLAIEAAGGEVLTVSADAGSPEALAAVFDQAIERFGRVDGVFHLAGDLSAEALTPMADAVDPAATASHFASKVAPAHALEKVLAALAPERAPGFVLLFSSISTVLGGVGFGPYAAANAVLDAIADAAVDRGPTVWKSVAWDGWKVPDAPRALAEQQGEHVMEPEQAFEALRRALAVADAPVLVNSVGDLAARRAVWTAMPRSAPPADAPRHSRPRLATAYVEPEGETERAIAAAWEALLGVEPVGRQDDFFELGGNSLIAAQILARLRDDLDLSLAVPDLLEHPTPAALAHLVETLSWALSEIETPEESGAFVEGEL